MSVASCHFTYCPPAAESLQQGDLLSRTPELEAVLREVHPHYFVTKNYVAFMVLTQSCDLVVRSNDGCKSRYLTLCGVRPFSLAVQRELERRMKTQLERIANVCRRSERSAMIEFVARLLNNNDPQYFYIHEEPSLAIHESMCAFLPLSIAIRAREHYTVCRNARIASLTDVFQAKLGWLVGNLYSRVGTPDWVPSAEESETFSKRLDEIVNGLCKWEDDKKIDKAKKDLKATVDLTAEIVRAAINKAVVTSRRDKVTKAIQLVLKDQTLLGESALSGDKINAVLRALASNQDYASALSP